MSFEIHVQAKKTNKNAHVLSPPPAGRPQLGDLYSIPTTAWAQCAYLALFPTWQDHSEVVRDCS